MTENDYSEQEISLIDLYRIFIKNLLFIIITSLVFLSMSTIYAFFIVTPTYTSQADVMVQVELSNVNTSNATFDYSTAFRLIDTISELMKKEIVLLDVQYELQNQGYIISLNELRSGTTITSSSNSYFINVEFEHTNPQLTKVVADELINSVIKITNEEDAFPVLTNKIRRTSFASLGTYSSPNKLLYSMIGLVIGGMISVGFVFLKEFLSQSFRSKEDLEQALNLQVIGIIPKIDLKRNAK